MIQQVDCEICQYTQGRDYRGCMTPEQHNPQGYEWPDVSAVRELGVIALTKEQVGRQCRDCSAPVSVGQSLCDSCDTGNRREQLRVLAQSWDFYFNGGKSLPYPDSPSTFFGVDRGAK